MKYARHLARWLCFISYYIYTSRVFFPFHIISQVWWGRVTFAASLLPRPGAPSPRSSRRSAAPGRPPSLLRGEYFAMKRLINYLSENYKTSVFSRYWLAENYQIFISKLVCHLNCQTSPLYRYFLLKTPIFLPHSLQNIHPPPGPRCVNDKCHSPDLGDKNRQWWGRGSQQGGDGQATSRSPRRLRDIPRPRSWQAPGVRQGTGEYLAKNMRRWEIEYNFFI